MRKESCPICGADKLQIMIRRDSIPVNQNVLFDSVEDAKGCIKRDLEMSICRSCGFIFNSKFDSTLNLYSQKYNNAQGASDEFLAYMESSADYVLGKYFGGGYLQKICEIGCGRNADYIRLIEKKLAQIRWKDIEIHGYDPSSSGYESEAVKIYPRYFDFEKENCENVDWLISRHVVEHLSEPIALFKNIHGLDRKNENAIGFFETPDAEWILDNKVVFDFFYEHCSLFSESSILKAAQVLDLNVSEVKKVFGGQYMWIFMKNEQNKFIQSAYECALEKILSLADDYIRQESLIFERISGFLEKRRKAGKIVVWGAGAKGNIFLNLFDRECRIIDSVIDINREKWNKFIAGTGHQTVSPDLADKDDIKTVIVMNRNYYNEIVARVKTGNLKQAEVIAIDNYLN